MKNTTVLPERFLALLEGIVTSLESGNVSFINYESLELEEIPVRYIYDIDRYDSANSDAVRFIYKTWKTYFWVMPPNSILTYRFMRRFVHSLKYSPVKVQLMELFRDTRSFLYFNKIVMQTELSEDWLVFKHTCFFDYVYDELLKSIEDIELKAFEEECCVDYKSRINRTNVRIPAKCMLCRAYLKNDEYINIICDLSRCDFDGKTKFQCGDFQSI